MIDLKQVNIDSIAEDAILISWPDVIAPAIAEQIVFIKHCLKECGEQKIIDTVSSYTSLLIYYRFDLITSDQLKALILKQLAVISSNKNPQVASDIIDIPVYYAGWDLNEVSDLTQLSSNEVIDLHCKHHYTAYAHGFVPGFCYLASIDKQIQLPRKATPRAQVPAGAVAIAQEQTAVYPMDTPGGWHILGFTPIKMFDIAQQQFFPKIKLGQIVNFTPICQEKYLDLGGKLHKEC
ncbi:5-oxoprolinase subunit PxpB [Thalassotalea marina]|uniref:Allophanate hydrolase n=1 Tax=Thalassotalea marina TaxID=1673741 RepID=A0A919EPS5_9GAMM|nr:5-oxoprolinase subunit PxpB [Thalassotalea marina]GHG05577.1 allophanate hydrolase [Thalassotalea marina]